MDSPDPLILYENGTSRHVAPGSTAFKTKSSRVLSPAGVLQ